MAQVKRVPTVSPRDDTLSAETKDYIGPPRRQNQGYNRPLVWRRLVLRKETAMRRAMSTLGAATLLIGLPLAAAAHDDDRDRGWRGHERHGHYYSSRICQVQARATSTTRRRRSSTTRRRRAWSSVRCTYPSRRPRRARGRSITWTSASACSSERRRIELPAKRAVSLLTAGEAARILAPQMKRALRKIRDPGAARVAAAAGRRAARARVPVRGRSGRGARTRRRALAPRRSPARRRRSRHRRPPRGNGGHDGDGSSSAGPHGCCHHFFSVALPSLSTVAATPVSGVDPTPLFHPDFFIPEQPQPPPLARLV